MSDNNQMREILEKLDEGVKSLFESDKYTEYLSVMSRFHNYSTRNTLLIYAQKPDAHRVAGYQSWRNNFNRQVKKGEHGIKILAPLPFAETKDFEKLDPETKQPILDEHGQPVMETLMRMGARFKTVSVFDISQTDGEPLPELAETLTGDVERYELFMDALRAVSPLPIVFEPMNDQDGYCEFGNKIAIREGMSEIQTIAAAIHELTHAKYHDRNSLDAEGKPKSKRVEETEAESAAFVVAAKFGIETGANSFGYIATWQKDTEAKELQNSLDTIRKTAAELIDGIEEKYRALAKERGIDLSAPVPQRAAEVSTEQNYNMIDGIINNEPDEPEQTADEPQHDPIRERLAALSQAETPDAKYEIAFSTLVDALCANEELLAVAATGVGWQKGAGRAALFDGGYFETLIDTYSAELADILSDKPLATRLNNTVRGEAYRRLDAIAYDRYILDEYADITKSGRLETYDKPFPEGSTGVLVCLTEQLSDGNVHDYGSIFGYYPDDNRDHAINNYLSLKSFAELRESVFGKPETSITLNYKETEPIGSTVLRRLLYTDGMFNRELKRTRVEVLPPMGKYSVYAQHLSGVIGDDTLIHVGTDSGYLLPLGVPRTRFEEQFVEAQIDSIFEKAPALLDEALADPEKFARYEWAAITGRIEETEQHTTVYKDIRAEKDRERREEISAAQAAADKEAKHKHIENIKENAGIIESGGNFKIDTMTYTGRNNLLELFALYDIDVPLATKGWFNNKLVSFEVSESGGYSYRSYQNKGRRTSYMGDAAHKKLRELRAAIKEVPVTEKLAAKGLLADEIRDQSAEQNNESKDDGENMEYSELQKKGFEIAEKHAHLPLKERLNIIAQSFGLKSASVFIQPCTGKYRGQSDIMLRLDGGGTIGIGMRSNATAKKDSTISECVNNALAKYNPEIVAEAKARAATALKAREAEDNYNAEQRGLKTYKFLNVELSDGGVGNGHTGWYYATIAVDNKIIPFITTDLASDIERGVLTEYVNRANYFVAGGLKDEDADFVFNNVGHSSVRDSYTVEMSAAARERAEKTLAAMQPDVTTVSVYAKYCNIVADRAGQYAVSSGTLLKKDVGDARSACDQIVNRVVNDLLLEAGEHYPLFKQYMSNPDFKARLEDYAFIKAYLEPMNVERDAAEPRQVAKRANTVENQLYEQFEKLYPQIVGGEYSYMKLESDGYEPLSVECIGDNRISVMHTYKMNGDLMYDPMIVFEIDKAAGTLTAVEFEQSMPPLYQRVTEGNGNGQSIDGNGNERTIKNLQGKINEFAVEWFDNLEEQAHIPARAILADREENAEVTFTADGEPIMPEEKTSESYEVTVFTYEDGGYDALAGVFDNKNEAEAYACLLMNDGYYSVGLKAVVDGEEYPITISMPLEEAQKNTAAVERFNKTKEAERSDQPESQKQSSLDIELPDPTVSIAEMREYGYTADELLPLSQARALEMFDANNTAVYLLYPDNTEGMALDREEIEQFDGLFGIEKPDWERLQALKTPVTAENSRESELLHNTPGMFGIYQVRDGIEDARDFRFAPMRELEAHGLTVDRANYELVYAAPLDIHDRQSNLNKIFADFQAENPERPVEYAGRSVSVSDVIVLQWRGEVSAHFVDSVGFKELPHFTGEEREQPKTAEQEKQPAAKQTFYQVDKRSSMSKGKPDFLAKIEANKQRVARDNQSPIQKNAEREVLT